MELTTPKIKEFVPYADNTVGHRANDLLKCIQDMENPAAPRTWADVFTPHNFRHAVASFLAEVGLPIQQIANYMQVEGTSLNKNYILPVCRAYDIPVTCMQRAIDTGMSPYGLLLIPYYHYQRVTAKNLPCNCQNIFHQPPLRALVKPFCGACGARKPDHLKDCSEAIIDVSD